jgi:hypothetical protein
MAVMAGMAVTAVTEVMAEVAIDLEPPLSQSGFSIVSLVVSLSGLLTELNDVGRIERRELTNWD